MKLYNRLFGVLFSLGLVVSTLQANAATRYLASPTIISQPKDGVASRSEPLATYRLSPYSAVELEGTLDPAIGSRIAVSSSVPFIPGRTLYGGDDRPGLYCDLMRNRGLGSSTACLRDSDLDGRFDEAVRYDFNSARSDMVFITDKGKVRGGKLKAAIPLREPIAYRVAVAAEMPTAEVQLLWSARDRKLPDGTKQTEVGLVVTDGSNFTGTEILSQNYAQVILGGDPVEFSFYG